MMQIEPHVLNEIAAENGWVHKSGRLEGTINARAMALALGVATSTVTRAYDKGVVGVTLLSKLRTATGRATDSLVTFPEKAAA